MSTSNADWPVIGIDLGTSYSCVGVWQHNRVEIITNDQGNRTTPSRVAFTDTERLIGEAADNQARTNPTNTIFDAKRLIGRKFHDETVQNDMRLWPFNVIAGPDFGNDKKPLVVVTFKGEEKKFSPEEISSMVLMKMKDFAEAYLDLPVKNAVVTVPAYFNDSQRQATKDAGAIAGLNVLRIINEPMAAAIAYGFENMLSGLDASKKNVLVFDLGGGTFDVSLVSVERDKFEVKAVGGDAHLGGSDFDNIMVDYFVEEFHRKHNKDLREDPKALGRLRAACERAKRALSMDVETRIELDNLLDGIDFSSTLTRARFDNLNMHLFIECIDLVAHCLSDAKIEMSEVDDVLLVGGSTRIPKVQQLLQEFFRGKELLKSLNPDEAIAFGAAFQAGILCGVTNKKGMVLVDVTPLSLGVELQHGNMSIVIPRNTAIPTKYEHTYGALQTTDGFHGGDIGDIQACKVEITVYEGEKQLAKDNNFLGMFELSGISPPSDGTLSFVNVCFEIDINGILNVSALELSSGKRSEITITNRSRLTMAEVEKMINEAEEQKAHDKKYKQLLKAKYALEAYANDILERLGDSDEIRPNDRNQQIFDFLDCTSNLSLDDAVRYEEKLEELKAICQPLILLEE